MFKTSAQLVADAKQNIKEIDIEQFRKDLNQQSVVIDVREPIEFNDSHIENAINFPRGVLEMQISQHPLVKSSTDPMKALSAVPIYLICRSGARSALAAESLKKMGLTNVFSVAGGMVSWNEK